MKLLRAWWFKPAKPWQFWMPQSGAIGGLILGTAIALAVVLLMGCRAGDSTAPSEGRDSVVVHGGLGEP